MTGDLRVGFVGLGSQGGPMARQIIDAGFHTTLWARRRETLEPFDDTPAARASSLLDLGAASDVLCVCVVDDDDVKEVLEGEYGALARMSADSIVVLHSTVHPETCRRLQAAHTSVHVLDAPVSGGGHRAAAGDLLVMVGGDARAFERCRPVLDTFANPLIHLGPLGAGQEAKLLNNALFAAQLGLAGDAFAIASDRGLDVGGLTTVLLDGSGRSYAAEVLAGVDHDLGTMATLAGELLAKDVGILEAVLAPASPHLLGAAQAAVERMSNLKRG